ncbi:MAG TPA: efflux RND transporter permease subunit [Planctomycetota bacterium]|nr:efflux RND transporter permease subunit [Planctomycetota bacterium]
MLKALIAFSLRKSWTVLLLAAATLAAAIHVTPRLPVDVFPELNAPTVVVLTEAPGLAAEDVERQVSAPLESAMNGAPGVRRLRSSSTGGLSLLWVEFDWGADLHRARQSVAERLQTARESLPPDAHAEIAPITSITGEILLLAVSSPDGSASPAEIRSYAEFDLRNRLLAIPGVAQAAVIGGVLPELQVLARQEALASYGLSFADVADAARAARASAPGGLIEDVERREMGVRLAPAVRDADDLGAVTVAMRDGAPIPLRAVADVLAGGAPRRGAASDRGAPAAVVSVQKAPGVNTLELTARVDAALDAAEASLPRGMRLNRAAFRQADFIRRSVDRLIHVLRDAALVVAIVLALFLMDVRTTLVTLAALPLSFAVALLAMAGAGMTLNVMTLGGLAVAVGELVDDAVIDVENVFRRLRQNRALPPELRKPQARVVFEAADEVRSAVVYATTLIVLVFAPLLFLEGLEGRFFRPLATSYVVSILASLLVALTVTPALCRLLLRGSTRKEREGFVVRALKRAYEPALRGALRRPGLVLGAATLATVAALGAASGFGSSFLPTFNEGTYTVFLFAPPGTSLAESDRMARGVERRLGEIPGVAEVVRRTGRAEGDEHAEPPSASEIEVTLRPDAEPAAVRRAVDAVLADAPGVTTMVGQPIEHRLSHVLSGTPAAVAVDLIGEDLGVLRDAARDVEAALRRLPGARDVHAAREASVESAPIRWRPADLAAAGLTPVAAARQVADAWHGVEAGEVREGARRTRIAVRLHPDERRGAKDLEEFLLRGGDGGPVRLRDVADVAVERSPNLVVRENGRRKTVVSLNVAEGSNLGDLAAEVARVAAPIAARAGCEIRIGGQFEARRSAARTLALFGGAVLVAMIALLRASTKSFRVALLVMVNLPLALIGGVAAVFLTEPLPLENLAAAFGLGASAYRPPTLSVASLVGFITLFGIAVRNGLLLVNHYDHVENVEGRSPAEAVVRGSMERLSPILMTALTAALGLLPLALAAGEPGSELLAPLSAVVLGGLVTSTLLNLFVVPAGYAWIRGVPRNLSGPAASTPSTEGSPPSRSTSPTGALP